MWRLVRSMLMWLLAVALPLQGVSAATMVAFDLGHQEHATLPAASHSHDHMAAAHMHTHVAAASAHEDAGTDALGKAKGDLGKGVVHKCSICASCCFGAIVPTEAVSFDAVKLPDLFAPLVPRTLAAYVTGGLERPPRIFLA